jgi:hypothetical protein
MANFNKSFNFRNGVQVDNDNFIVNENGLVGIGTTIPRDYLLNVYGDARFSGIVTSTNLYADESDIGYLIADNANISGVITASTFYGSAAGLTGIYAIAVDGWHITSGTISTTAKVGVGTTSASGDLQIGIAVTINSDGNATYTGIVSALSFSGIGSDITQINADNISTGTLTNDRLPSDVNLSGIVTAYSFSGFGTDITGINASNISSGTLSNSRLPNDINISGIITASSFDGIGSNLTQLNASNISSGTLSNSRLPSNISVSGVVTATGGLVGNLTGTASTAQSLTGTPSIIVDDITGSNLNLSGIVTATTLLAQNIGIGTSNPISELQIRKTSDSLLEVISDSAQARISIGQSVGVGKSTAVLVFGNSPNSFDIINNDTGDIRLYLHDGPVGINTGKFRWIYGQTNNDLLSLDYDGTLIATGDVFLGSSGIGTVTVQDNLYVSGDLEVNGTLTATINYPDIISNTNLNTISGITTLQKLNVTANIGIDTNNPSVGLDARGVDALFSGVGIGTTTIGDSSLLCEGTALFTTVGIGTTAIYTEDVQTGSLQIHNNSIRIFGGRLLISNQNLSGIGFGTYNPRSILDFGNVGSATSLAYFIPPTVTNTGRNTFADTAGLTTSPGAIIYNDTEFRHQGYGSTDGGLTFAWHNLY